MQNRFKASYSFNKRNIRQNYTSQEQKQNQKNTYRNLNQREIINKITDIYNYYYSYYFPSILNISKICFFEKLEKSIDEAISLITKNNINYTSINQTLIKLKDNIENKYDKDYQILSTSYQNYLNNQKKFEHIKLFRKHCARTGSIAIHPCSNRTQGNFIFIQSNDKSSSYAMCSKCRYCYKSDFILMLCISCNKKYYSTILSEKDENNLFPATWEKYHCNSMVNEIMKCIKCRNILYFDLLQNKLVCKNQKCNFISDPESILWNCSICKEEFRSKAKVYNPLEFQILKNTIHMALLLQKQARPKELPCRCEKDLNKLIFFHKEECRGLLYQGMLIDKEVIVCSKCHSINFEEKFNWICPICLTSFYLHNVNGVKPFSRKKYIINQELTKSESSSKRRGSYKKSNVYYYKNDKYIEKRINNIRAKNLITQNNENTNEISNKEILNNRENNYRKNINNRNKTADYPREIQNTNMKHYSTLKDLLKKRESSKSRNNQKLNIKNIEQNESEEIKRQPKRKHYYTSNKITEQNKIKMESYINTYIEGSKNIVSSLINNIEKEKENKNNKSPFVSPICSPKNIKKFGKYQKAQEESTGITTNKVLNGQSPNENKLFNLYNSNTNNNKTNIKKEKNQLNSFKSWQTKSNPYVKSKIINSFLVTNNINDKTEKKSCRNMINDFRTSEKYISGVDNSSFKYSILNNIKNINNFNINININTPRISKYEREENKHLNEVNKSNEDNNEKIEDEFFEKFEEKSNKRNIRESLIIERKDISLQNILITQEKLSILTKQTKIPIIQETDYTFINEIGEGTYGDVYLVENNSTSEKYAMKKIICRDYNELIKHKNELELIFSVKHENILKVLGIQFKCLDETTGLIYVLMELAYSDWNKEIKNRILAKKYYKENELIDILKQIIKGFLFLQKKNIAHRDIKPQNILLFPNKIYKIADFGEAKKSQNKADQSTLRGSELYMSPLLYKGYKYNQKTVVHNPYKSDVFSLGYCLLYAICLNLKVLENVRESSTLRSVINIINKYNINNRYSDEFMKIIYGMIEPNEEIRFDFEDLFSELNKL